MLLLYGQRKKSSKWKIIRHLLFVSENFPFIHFCFQIWFVLQTIESDLCRYAKPRTLDEQKQISLIMENGSLSKWRKTLLALPHKCTRNLWAGNIDLKIKFELKNFDYSKINIFLLICHVCVCAYILVMNYRQRSQSPYFYC